MKNQIYDAVMRAFPATTRGAIDYHFGHHTLFYPWGGPMNGQTARLEAVRDLVFALQPALIVETGTFRGTTTQWFAQFGCPVVSVEVSLRFYEFSRRRLRNLGNVQVVLGNSVDLIKHLAADPVASAKCTVFYLDSHGKDYLPIREELETIFSAFTEFMVVVDDFKVEGDAGYGYDNYGGGKGNCSPPNRPAYPVGMTGTPASAARRASIAVRPCNRPVAMTLAAAA